MINESLLKKLPSVSPFFTGQKRFFGEADKSSPITISFLQIIAGVFYL